MTRPKSDSWLLQSSKKQDFVADAKTHLTGSIVVYSSLIWGEIPNGGYLILDDTILQKYTRGLSLVFKLKDTKTGGFILGVKRGNPCQA